MTESDDSISLTNPPSLWGNYSLRLEIETAGVLTPHRVPKPYAILGSSERADVILPDPQTPARSVYLHATAGGIYCVLLNRPEALNPKGIEFLQADHELSIGKARIHVTAAPPGPTEGSAVEPVASTVADSSQVPWIEVYQQGAKVADAALRYHLTIAGRTRRGGMGITCRSVSRTHCALFWEFGKLWAIDLLSANGTRLEGRRIEAALVPPQSCIDIGNVQLVFRGFADLASGGSSIGAGTRKAHAELPDQRQTVQQATAPADDAQARLINELKAELEQRDQARKQAEEDAQRLADELRASIRELEQRAAEAESGQALAAREASRGESRSRLLDESLRWCLAELRQASSDREESEQQAIKLRESIKRLEHNASAATASESRASQASALADFRNRLLDESLRWCMAELHRATADRAEAEKDASELRESVQQLETTAAEEASRSSHFANQAAQAQFRARLFGESLQWYAEELRHSAADCEKRRQHEHDLQDTINSLEQRIEQAASGETRTAGQLTRAQFRGRLLDESLRWCVEALHRAAAEREENHGRANQLRDSIAELEQLAADTASSESRATGEATRAESRSQLLSESLRWCLAELHRAEAERRSSDQRIGELQDSLRELKQHAEELEAELESSHSAPPPEDDEPHDAGEIANTTENVAATEADHAQPAPQANSTETRAKTVKPAALPDGEPSDAAFLVSFHQSKRSPAAAALSWTVILLLWALAISAIGGLGFVIVRWILQVVYA